MLDQLTGKIIGGVFQASHVLDSDFLEKFYENALALERGQLGLALAFDDVYRRLNFNLIMWRE
jgi:hypothetical protein